MCKTVRQRKVPEMPYLTKAQVEYLHNAWNKSSGIDRLQDIITRVQGELTTKNEQLEQAQIDLAQAGATINGLESTNQTLSAVNTQQAATITELTNQLEAANQNQMPNNIMVVEGDITLYLNCIVFMSFTPSDDTFNVATINRQEGNRTIDYPGMFRYLCIMRTQQTRQAYRVTWGLEDGAHTEDIPGESLSIHYSANNNNILLLNHTD